MKQILSVIGAIFGIFMFGKYKGKQEEQNKNIKTILNDVEKQKKINEAVSNSSDAELDDELSKFNRR